MTMYGRPFYQILPFASLATIIYGSAHGNGVKLKRREKTGLWYYGRRFFSKKRKNEYVLW
jgi:hypothetical protein